jgi:nucleoside-diphosphate-sugar epimerase
MKQIVITGANGFTGSHVLEAFQRNTTPEYAIVAACRDDSKLLKSFLGDTLVGDLTDKEYINRLTSMADIICHTAAWAEMNGNDENSKKYFYYPTIDLIDSAIKNGVKRFIFLSSITSNPVEQNRIHSKRPLDKIWPHYDSIIRIEDHLKNIGNREMEQIILRVGFFVGSNYSLGILPILLPRLKTHLVPWINHGKTSLPLVDGRDIGLAFQLSATVSLKNKFNIIDIVGREIPGVKQVFNYLHDKYKYPLPHFSVTFKFAYFFSRIMQLIHKVIPGDPLIVPAIVLLLEETKATNEKAEKILGFNPKIHWKESVDLQLEEMDKKQKGKMKMNKEKYVLI